MSEQQRITCEIRDNIAWVRLNRPEKLNGLDMAMFEQMVKTARTLRRNRSVRAVILSGNGDSFCAGLDFKAVSKNPKMIPRVFLKWPWTKQNLAQEIAHCWRDLPVPVICAIHGNCFGGGMQIALASDYRIARADANLCIMEMKWGLIPDMSGMVTLSRLTRVDIAQELTMTARQFSAQEGYEYGLISRLADDPLAEAEALARDIATKSPDAIAATKYLFKKSWKADTWKALRWERWVQARLLGRKNQRIAMKNGLAPKGTEPKPFADRSSFR
ncbi:crotonase/enoyl-CoA hydratase family protein [Thalassolituus sp.]|uniref:crotonase/enoyl-CoA hydratase family protein n=1 Tax=Thalassolituus sp. TaxID=2030822 RepID=UPI002622414B|nr:crotonase/enoyl-CoA hydratase family protein [uncultured Thalassolituus sp.]TNC92744.1 MAG: enoyl-CoA hydratase [Thalassolituus sp.]